MDDFNPTGPATLSSFLGNPLSTPADLGSIQPLLAADQLSRPAETLMSPSSFRVNFLDPEDTTAPRYLRSSDPFLLDPDPSGVKTVEWGKANGVALRDDDVNGLNVFGRTFTRERLLLSDAGRELLDIATKNRQGRKRDFWEALTDFSVSDLPFVSLVANVAGSIKDAVTVSDTLKKLQSNEAVSDEDLIKTRLVMAKSERSSKGTWGAMVGDIMRAAPGFMAEFALTGGLGAMARTAAARSAKTGIHVSMTRASKKLTDELMELEMKKLGTEVTQEAMEQARKSVADSVLKNTMFDELYEGLSQDALSDMALRRAAYSQAQYLSRTQGGKVANGLARFGQYLKSHASQGLMDFGTWGTDASTVAFSSHTSAGRALSDALGAFLIEAPIRGALMWAPNQYIAKPLIGAAFGQDGRAVSRSQLELQQVALMTQNKSLMDNAESIASAQNLLEYVSENAGRGFSPLMQSAGIGIDKLVAKAAPNAPRLVAPAVAVVHEGAAGRLISPDAGVTVGGALRKWVDNVLGTAKDFRVRMETRKADVVAKALGATDELDKQAITTMVMTGRASGLRPELAARVGDDVQGFIEGAFNTAYEEAKKEGRVKAFARYTLAEWMNKHNVSPQSIMNLYQKMGYDGILGEMFEERYSDVAKGLFGWDERPEEEKGFFENIVQAVKNAYPEGGFSQLSAEAVGFAVPMLTRALTMRIASAAGGGGIVEDTKRRLEPYADAMRMDEIVQMKHGTFLTAREYIYAADAEAVQEAEQALNAAKAKEVTNENEVAGLEANLQERKLIAERRRARYDEQAKSISEAAQGNLDAMVNVQLWSDQALSATDYNRRKSYTEEQTRRSLAGRNALVEFAPELGKRLAQFESSFEGEDLPWYRTVAQKLVGFTGGLLTGDFSLMTHNPIQWHAQDYRLSKTVCEQLKTEYRKEWERQKSRLQDEQISAAHERSVGVIQAEVASLMAQSLDAVSGDVKPDGTPYTQEEAIEIRRRLEDAENRLAAAKQQRKAPRQAGETFAIAKNDIDAATDASFAPRARQIMAAHLESRQFRSFTQSRVKDQAIEHVAANHGYTFTVEKDESGVSTPVFYKIGEDGEFTGEKASVDKIYSEFKDEVDQAHDDITVATVDLMTRHLTRPEDAQSKLLALARLPRNLSNLSHAVYESALALVGSGTVAHAYQVTRNGLPLLAQLEGASSKVNMDVVAYLAQFERYDDEHIDQRAYESVAHALGESFEGTEASLAERNKRIHHLARIANAVDNKNVVYFVGSTAKVDSHDSRINSGNVFFLKAELQSDGTYSVTTGFDPETGERITLEHKTYDELTAALSEMNFVRAPTRLRFTHAKLFEFDDMYTALRELGLVPVYRERCAELGNQHPMLRRNDAGEYAHETEDRAYEELEELRALASRWDPQLKEAPRGTDPEEAEKIKDAWETLYDPKTGFVTIGEQLLREHGVSVDTLDKYAGVFVPYKRPRYVMTVDTMRGSVNSPEMLVPIDFRSGVSAETSLLNAHVMDAYAKHPRLLRDTLRGPISDFIRQVGSTVDVLLEDAEIAKDEPLVKELTAFRRAYCDSIDTYDAVTKTWHRAAGLTPGAFTFLGVQFALRRAGVAQDGVFLRAVATLAPYVYRLPSYTQFMNVVDLVLGGNGFLNEIIAHNAKKSEVFGTQKGIRGLLAEVEEDPDAFRKAFTGTLPNGADYDSFVAEAQNRYKSLVRSGVPTAYSTVQGQETAAVSQVVAETARAKGAANAGYDTEAAAQRSVDAVVNAAVTRSDNINADVLKFIEQNKDFLESKQARQDLQKLIDTLKTERDRLVATGQPVDVALTEQIAKAEDQLDAVKPRESKIGGSLPTPVRAALNAGKVNRGPVARLTGAPSQGFRTRTQFENDEVDLRDGMPDARNTIVSADNNDYLIDTPSLFEAVNDDGELSIVFGARQAEGRELTRSQARLAVNIGVRVASSWKQDASEDVVVQTIRTMMPGVTTDDLIVIMEEYRALAANLAKDGRSLSDVNQVSSGSLWSEDEDKDDKGSSDNFNEKSVAQYESEELKDFLALAQRCSPETGRNFQGFIKNIRELNRWLRGFVKDHTTEMAGGESALDAVEFLHGFLNPRGTTACDTMSQRLALFESTLRRFDTDGSAIRGYIGTLLDGGRGGRKLSHKGAFLLAYLSTLKPNARNTFSVLLSNSVVSSAVRVDATTMQFKPYVRPAERVGENIVVNSFIGLAGRTRDDVAAMTARARERVLKLKEKLVSKDQAKANPLVALRRNGTEIAYALSEIIGTESPIFSALTSPGLLRYLALSKKRGTLPQGLETLVSSLAPWEYAQSATEKIKSTGVEFVDIILSTMDLISGQVANSGREGTGDLIVTRGEISSFFTAAFMTGNPLMNQLTRAVNSPDVTSPLMTLMAFYDASLPETVVRADFDKARSTTASSVAVASRGCIPLGNRFADGRYEELCKTIFGDVPAEVLAECKADLTWPDEYRTPIFAKSLSRHLNVKETLVACETSYRESTPGNPWWVPVYAGDHASAVMIQMPPQSQTTWAAFKDVKDYKTAANIVCDWLGLGLLGADAKRSAVSSLEAPGVSLRGVVTDDKGNPVLGDDGKPKFGKNRLAIVENLDESYQNEELKGGTLMFGYGARQLRSMAKDPLSPLLKAHLINPYVDQDISFIKSLVLAPDASSGEFPEGTMLRALSDFGNKLASQSADNVIITDRDSAKIGPAVSPRFTMSKEGANPTSLMNIVFDRLRALRKEDPKFKLSLTTAELDGLIGDIYDTSTEGLAPLKLSDVLPGVETQEVTGLAGGVGAVSLTYEENEMVGYTVANVSHDCVEPKEAGRTPRNHEIDALAMAAALSRMPEGSVKLSDAELRRVFDLIADWGLCAAATVNDDAFRAALLQSSSTIQELRRHGENWDGQNIKEELTRMINARLKRHLNIPLNSYDAALLPSGALVNGKRIADHNLSPMYRALNQGSQLFNEVDEEEVRFYGVDRRVAHCRVNAKAPGFRHGWFLDTEAFRRATTGDEAWAATYFEQAQAYRTKLSGSQDTRDQRVVQQWTDDRTVLVALEAMFTDLRGMEARGETAKAAALRLHIGEIFQNHHGQYLVNVKDSHGRTIGDRLMKGFSFEDLFRNDGKGGRIFDRSAVCIDGDRVPLDAETDSGKKNRIYLGGSLCGLPRTPSYNGSMWLQVVRASLPVDEIPKEVQLADGSTEVLYFMGYVSSVMPDPDTLEILGCDHDGDKTKLYFYHSNGGAVTFGAPPAFEGPAADFATDPEARRTHRENLIAAGMMARKYVDVDGRVREIDPEDPETYENEFYDLSEETRKQVSNTFVRSLFDMAYALPTTGEDGTRRNGRRGARVPFAGGVVSRSTGPTSCVGGKDRMKALLRTPNVPQGFLKPEVPVVDENGEIVRNEDGSPVTKVQLRSIGDVEVMQKVSDGAKDASDARGNTVAIYKDLHLSWATGLFVGEGDSSLIKVRSLANASKSWWDFCYHADGISNSTFDDMKEQICSRLRWRSGMIDILVTDILRNRQEDGSRGYLPTTDEEFFNVLSAYSQETCTEGTPRWWMDRTTDKTDAEAHHQVTEYFGDPDAGHDLVTSGTVAKALGLKRVSADKWEIDEAAQSSRTVRKIVGKLLIQYGLHDLVSKLSMSRGQNYATGYLISLLNTYRDTMNRTSDVTTADMGLERGVEELANWFSVKRQLEDARDFVKSFNIMGIDIGDDVESGTRDRIAETFESLGTLRMGAKMYVPEEDLRKMHAAMLASYDIGADLMTTTAKGILASSRYSDALGQVVGTPGADVFVKSLLLDRIEPFAGNRLQLQSNVQQVGYVMGALSGLPPVEGSPVNGPDSMYYMLQSMAQGVMVRGPVDAKTGVSKSVLGTDGCFALRRAIESAFGLMYHVATCSDEHRLGNNVFSYFARRKDSEYAKNRKGKSTPGSYSYFDDKLFQILTKFKATDEASAEAIRAKVEKIIQGESFSGAPKNFIGYDFKGLESFSLNKKNLQVLRAAADGHVGDETTLRLRDMIEDVDAVLAVCAKNFGDSFEITPAMLFGQLLPMYSVLNSRTVGAPVPSGTSLFNMLPLRIYEAISAEQAYMSMHAAPILDIVTPLNWAPRKRSLGLYRSTRSGVYAAEGRANPTREESLMTDRVAQDILDGKHDRVLHEGKPREVEEMIKSMYIQVRGEDAQRKGAYIKDFRGNPERRNMFDLFAGDGLILDAVKAVPHISRIAPPRGTKFSEIVKGDATPNSTPVTGEYKSEVAHFAKVMGALTGSWTTVDYKGGDSFVISGALKGDLGKGRNVVIHVSVDGNDKFLDNEAEVRAAANSKAYAASFCAKAGFRIYGQPMTTEQFFALPESTRMCLVRRYQIGGATSNRVAWTVDGRGIATLTGAIKLNLKGQTSKVYHEYFHQMMRMFENLGMFGQHDYEVLANTFGVAPAGTNTAFDEEKAAEAFRKWVAKNTTPVNPDGKTGSQVDYEATANVFRKIFNFLKQLWAALRNFFSYDQSFGGDEPGELLFNMAVHGIAQSSGSLREEVQTFRDANPDDVRVADGIRGYSEWLLSQGDFRGPMWHEDKKNPENWYRYTREDIARIFEEFRSEDPARVLNDEGEALYQTQKRAPKNYRQQKARDNAITFISRRETETLRGPVEEAFRVGGLGDLTSLDDLIKSSDDVNPQTLKVAEETAEQLNSDIVAGHDIADGLEQLVILRQQLVHAVTGAQPSVDTSTQQLSEVSFAVEETPADPVDEAVSLATVARDTEIDASDISVTSRIGSLIMQALENNLKTTGSWQTSMEDAMKSLGNPKATTSLLDRDIARSTIRQVLNVVDPKALERLTDADIEKSAVFEALLRVHQRLHKSFAKQDANAPGAGANRSQLYKSYGLSRFNLGAWLFSTAFPTPQAVAQSGVDALETVLKNPALAGSTLIEVQRMHRNIVALRDALDDVTGLIEFSSRGLDELLDTAISEAFRGTEPIDGNRDLPFDEQGFFKDVRIVSDPADGLSADRAKALANCLDSNQNIPVDLQNALRIAKTTALHLAAMVKFYQQTETTPLTAADVEYSNLMAKFAHAKAVDDKTWMASQAIGSSMLLDNQNLVDYYDQSYFIAGNVDAYLANLVRQSFGGETVREAFDGNKDFGAIKSKILNLENFLSFLFGTNVKDGGSILKVALEDRNFEMRFGEIVHGEIRDEAGNVLKRIKFDNYRYDSSGVQLDREDLRVIDIFLKMCSAYAQGQRGVVTGVDAITFNDKLSVKPEDYTKDEIEKRYEEMTKGGRSMSDFEMALHRMFAQIPESILFGEYDLYNRFVNAACAAMRDAREARTSYRATLKNPAAPDKFDFNTYVLRSLSRSGFLVAHEDNQRFDHERLPMLRTGVITLGCDEVDRMFRESATLKNKLLSEKRGHTDLLRSMLTRDYVRDECMKVYREAARLAAKHPWLTEGDGRFLNNFGTSLPFFRGSGVFMYDANRVKREKKRSYVTNLSKYEASFLSMVTSENSETRFIAWDSSHKGQALIDLLADLFRTPQRGAALYEAIDAGKYAEANDYGLLLPADCTIADVATVIYSKFLELAELEEAGALPGKDGRPIVAVSGDKFIEMYEAHVGVDGDMFGGHTGLNDEQMFRLHGVLPANEQLGHKVHKAIDGLANAIIQRGTLVTMLMTPSGDGSPIYYVNPSDYAVEASGIPDVVWEQLARWWGSFNGITYDEKLSGVKNAQMMFKAIQKNIGERGGRLTLKGNGDDDEWRGHRYQPLPQGESDLLSITDWLVQDDEQLGDESSLLNGLAGGEAMGYLRHLVQSSRVLGFGGPKVRATLHRALSWSKSLSVSFSMFFPIATKWESPVGAVGTMATLASNVSANMARSNPELFNAVQKMFGGVGWITKDFLGFSDILQMMDSNDPFLAELISWAEALGIKISDRFVNPVEPTRGLVEHDLRQLEGLIKQMWKDDAEGSKAAGRFSRFANALLTRHGEKAFSYALNATKLATVAQMYLKLRREAEAQGRAFDPIRDLRQYTGYINAEVGGIDPLKYAWAHPRGRGILNTLLFSWEWTRGAWEAGGGNILEDFLFGGKSITKEEREFMFGRWTRMYLSIMIGIPAILQLFAWGVAKLAGGTDDDDTPFTWENEDKTKLIAADLTPLLKRIGQSDLFGLLGGKTLAELKKDHPALLAWLPAYTGMDKANQKTRNRRLYMHFGKQGWEFFRWFDSPWKQFVGKLAMPWQRGIESFIGYNPGYIDRALPWEDKGALERWLDPTMDGALANLALTFVPFSAAGMFRMGDAGLLNVVGPVQYGASYTAINDRMVAAIEAYARNDRKFYAEGYAHKGKRKRWMRSMLTDIVRDAKLNGITDEGVDKMIGTAAGQVTNSLYGELLAAIPEDPSKSFDAGNLNRIGRSLNRAGSKYKDVLKSLKDRLESQHRGWKDKLTPQQRYMYQTLLHGTLRNPFNESLRETEMSSARVYRDEY